MVKDFKDYGIQVSGSGEVRALCPKCSHERKKSTNKDLAVNIDEGVWFCHHCNWRGGLKERPEHNPIIKPEPLSPDKPMIDYFFKRGIQKPTLDRCKVEYQNNKIAFQYFKGLDLVNIKFRGRGKKFTQTKGGQRVFYNLNTIGFSDYVVITEGEIDTLSFEQIGIKAISVPDGGGQKNLDFIENSLKYLETIKTYYLCLDQDDKGKEIERELARRLGKAKCFVIDLKDCKDANEYLMKYGEDGLNEAFETAEPYPLESVLSPLKFWDDMLKYLHEGVKQNPKSLLIDENLINLESQLVIVTGIPSHGKTTFMLNYLVRIASFSNWKSAIFSPEHSEKNLLKKLIMIYTGKTLKGTTDNLLTPEIIESTKPFISRNFAFINSPKSEFNLNDVIESIEYLVLTKGIKSVLIDSYMKLQTDIKHNSETLTIQGILNRLSKLCKDYDITIFLIAHPRKMEKLNNGNFKPPSLYDISGSKAFFDIADVGITVYRNFEGESSTTEILIRKVREEGETGKIGTIDNLVYNHLNHRFTKDQIDYDQFTNSINEIF